MRVFHDKRPFLPACREKAEVLKVAPPWRVEWATPTVRQRFLPWLANLTSLEPAIERAQSPLPSRLGAAK